MTSSATDATVQRPKAVLVIDAQVGLMEGDRPVQNQDALFASINVVLAKARAAHVPVLYVQDTTVGGKGSRGYAVHAAVAPRENEPSVSKDNCDAFHETRLEADLRALGVGHLVVVGCKSQYCVDTTIRRATSLGYDVTLVGDAHGTNDSDVIPAATIVAHTNRTLEGFGTDVGTVRVVSSSALALG